MLETSSPLVGIYINHRHTLYLPHNVKSFQADVLHNLTTFSLFFSPTERRSVRSVEGAPESNKLSLSSSSSSDQDSSVVPTAIAVSASVLGVVGSVVGVALLASFVRRRNTVRSTITV